MISWSTIGSLFRRATALQWAPTLAAHDPNPPLNLEDPAAGGGITGTSANTQRAQTSVASGSLILSGSSAGSQKSQTSVSAGSIRVSGTGAGTQRAQTSDSSGSISVSGSAAGSQRAQTSTSSGSLTNSGSSGLTQSAQTSTASGSVGSSTITGTSANSQGVATSTASGTIPQTSIPGGGGSTKRKPFRQEQIPLPPVRKELTGYSINRCAPARSDASGAITVAGASVSRVRITTSQAKGTIIDEAEELMILVAMAE